MRYELRWSNGFWKLFDTHFYCGIHSFGFKAQAMEAVAEANAGR